MQLRCRARHSCCANIEIVFSNLLDFSDTRKQLIDRNFFGKFLYSNEMISSEFKFSASRSYVRNQLSGSYVSLKALSPIYD